MNDATPPPDDFDRLQELDAEANQLRDRCRGYKKFSDDTAPMPVASLCFSALAMFWISLFWVIPAVLLVTIYCGLCIHNHRRWGKALKRWGQVEAMIRGIVYAKFEGIEP